MGLQLAPNLVIADRFRLNRLLGKGGMGSVWHATHLGLDIPCAVKFIEGEFAQLPEAQARFEREAKAAAHLRSPHVVQILDHGVWQGTPYIAMELLDGEDLGKRLQKVGRLGPQELNPIIQQVCRALTKAHAGNVVHRDLKPDNIFLVRDDDREIAKVLDFGIAKANSNAIEGSNTKTGAMLGTPYYMSPEQAQGTKSVDWRSDLWSLAVIVFQCVTGKLPFDSEALGDLLVKIIVNPIPVPSQVSPDVPQAFDRWWARAASRDPAQRFQSAKELADSLGLVWGMSQMTDVMDRNAMRAIMQSGGQYGHQTGPAALTPNGYHMAQTPQPQLQNTPNPGMPNPAMHGSPAMANTPNPGGPGFAAGGPMAAPGTGSMGGGRTFNGQVVPDGLPKKTSGGLVAGIAIGLTVLIGGGIAAGIALKGKNDSHAAAQGSSTSGAGASTATTATATPTSTPIATAAATTTASAADSAGDHGGDATAPASASAAPVAKKPGGGTNPTVAITNNNGGATKPAPMPAPQPAKPGPSKPPKDLGF